LKAADVKCKSSGRQCCLRSPDASCADDAWTPAICHLPTVEVLKITGNRMTIKCVIRQRPVAAAIRRGVAGRYQPESKNSTKLPAFSAEFRFNPGAIAPWSPCLKSSLRALTGSSGSCQRAQVVSHHVPRQAQRCRLLQSRPVEQENVTKGSEATRKILARSSLLPSRCASKGSIGRFSALGTDLLCPQPTVNAAHATT
jgi:hypothetical protein